MGKTWQHWQRSRKGSRGATVAGRHGRSGTPQMQCSDPWPPGCLQLHSQPSRPQARTPPAHLRNDAVPKVRSIRVQQAAHRVGIRAVACGPGWVWWGQPGFGTAIGSSTTVLQAELLPQTDSAPVPLLLLGQHPGPPERTICVDP